METSCRFSLSIYLKAECESDRDNDDEHGDLNEVSADTDSCDKDYDKDF